MSFPSSFAGQLAAIMDVLSRAAVAEITTLVEGGSAALRREVSRRDGEILHLRTTLKMMEAELCRAQQTATNRATRDQQEQTTGGKQVSRTDEVDQETGPVYPEPNPAGSVCELHQGTYENIGPEVKEEPADGPVAVETADLEVEDSMWSAPAGHSVSLQVLSSRAAERSADRNTECSFSSSEDCSGVPVKAEPQILSECGERSSQSVHGDPLTQFSHALDNQGAGPSQAPPPAQDSAAGTPGSNSEDHVHNRNTWRTKRQVNMWRANQRGFPRLDDNNSSHQPLKPFRCLECGKSFTQKTRLKTHQSVHTGERPFSCSICGKMFSRQDNCLRHERFHSGLKPFSCRQCGRSFTVLGNLRIHQEIHLQGR